MTYNETLDWMFGKLPMYQRQGSSAYRKDLTNTLLLCRHLGNPERDLKFIHIAGTNGKGSTSHMLASVLFEAGYKTGLFTSPHLTDFRERIKINGKEIPEDVVVGFIGRNRDFFEQHDLSFFEMTIGLAFEFFRHENCEVVVLETGMGGRLDSTNVVTPEVSVITNIGIDHSAFLGSTISSIAFEKAGIIKPGVPVVIGEATEETLEVFWEKAKTCNAPIVFAFESGKQLPTCDLKGSYQIYNIRTALETIYTIADKFSVSEDAIKNGFASVVKNTGLRGRWQTLQTKPLVICDTAHNSHGLKHVMKQVLEVPCNKLHIVFGIVNDKDPDEMLPLLPRNAEYYFCKPSIPRAMDDKALAEAASIHSLFGKAMGSVTDAYAAALENAASDDFVFIGGSTFVVSEILEKTKF